MCIEYGNRERKVRQNTGDFQKSSLASRLQSAKSSSMMI